MKVCFELATELAFKGTIGVISCVFIAYVSTHAETPFGFASAFLASYFLIGVTIIIICTYKMSPLCAPTHA
jgi:hypothetical protein